RSCGHHRARRHKDTDYSEPIHHGGYSDEQRVRYFLGRPESHGIGRTERTRARRRRVSAWPYCGHAEPAFAVHDRPGCAARCCVDEAIAAERGGRVRYVPVLRVEKLTASSAVPT